MPTKAYNVFEQQAKDTFKLVTKKPIEAINADAATDDYMDKAKLEKFKGFAVAVSNIKEQDVQSEVETKTRRVRSGGAAPAAKPARKKPGPKPKAEDTPAAAAKPKAANGRKRGASTTGKRAKAAAAKPAKSDANPFL